MPKNKSRTPNKKMINAVVDEHSQANYLYEHTDIQVKIVFVDGKALVGDLLGYDQFTLTLLVKGKRVLIYKSSVKYVHKAANQDTGLQGGT